MESGTKLGHYGIGSDSVAITDLEYAGNAT